MNHRSQYLVGVCVCVWTGNKQQDVIFYQNTIHISLIDEDFFGSISFWWSSHTVSLCQTRSQYKHIVHRNEGDT
jgi:hypothetical protein